MIETWVVSIFVLLMFSEIQINEFIELFEKEFGLRISREQAEIYASQLIDFLTATYKDKEHQYDYSKEKA